MILETLASHSLSRKIVLCPLPIGVLGQVVQNHAAQEVEQRQEHALTILEAQAMGHLQSKKLARQKNVAVTLGHSGAQWTLAVIADPVHTKNKNLDKSLFKLCARLKENLFRLNIPPSIVQTVSYIQGR